MVRIPPLSPDKSNMSKELLLLLHLILQDGTDFIQDFEDLRIPHADHHPHTFFARRNEMALLHQRHMAGNIRLFAIEGRNEFADTFLAFSQTFENPKSCRLSENFEHLGLHFDQPLIHGLLHDYMIH